MTADGTSDLMTARLLDGKAIAEQIRLEVRPGVDAVHRADRDARPGLGIVLVGDDPASAIYVRNKLKSAGENGLRADLERLPASASLAELLAIVDRLNRSEVHDGILVQSPLPPMRWARTPSGVCSMRLPRRRTSTGSIRPTSDAWCRTGLPSRQGLRPASSRSSSDRASPLPASAPW